MNEHSSRVDNKAQHLARIRKTRITSLHKLKMITEREGVNNMQNRTPTSPAHDKMAMTNFVSTLCLVLLYSTISFGSGASPATANSSLDGTYTLDQTNSDNINDVIEEALRKMNVLKRFIARGRLKKLNPVTTRLPSVLLRMKSASLWITSRHYEHRQRVRLSLGLVLTAERRTLACSCQTGTWCRHSRQQTGAGLMITP